MSREYGNLSDRLAAVEKNIKDLQGNLGLIVSKLEELTTQVTDMVQIASAQEYPIVLLLEGLQESKRVFQSDISNVEFATIEKKEQPSVPRTSFSPAGTPTGKSVSFSASDIGKHQIVSPILPTPCYNLLVQYLTTGSNSLELTGLSVTDLGNQILGDSYVNNVANIWQYFTRLSRIFVREKCCCSYVCLADFTRKFPGVNITPLHQHTRYSVLASLLDESPFGVILTVAVECAA
jgi:hypothetical protein